MGNCTSNKATNETKPLDDHQRVTEPIFAPPPSNYGVSMAFIDKFVSDNYDILAAEMLTTTDVCNRFVKPTTREHACSYADFILAQEHAESVHPVNSGIAMADDTSCQPAAVDKATVFVSHAWGYNFLELVECLRSWWVANGSRADVYFWLDVFVVNQHGTSERPFEWWQNAFRTQMRDIGHALVVLSPWSGPKYVQRAWCLFELYTMVSLGITRDIVLPPKQKAELVEYLKGQYHDYCGGGVFCKICNIDIENATAFLKSDLDRILQLISKETGFKKLNELIFSELRDWIVSVAREALAAMPDEERVRCTLDLKLGDVLWEQGRYFDAESHLRERYAITTAVLGPSHPNTQQILLKWSFSMPFAGLYLEVYDILTNYLNCVTPSLGETHPGVLKALTYQAFSSWCNGHYRDSESVFKPAYRASVRILGFESGDTLFSAQLMSLCGAYVELDDETIEVCRATLEFTSKAMGSSHPLSLFLQFCGGRYMYVREEYEKAEVHIRRVLEKLEIIGGDVHHYTAFARHYLGDVLVKMGRSDEALVLFELAMSQHVCPTIHSMIMVSKCDALVQLGRIDEAVALTSEIAEVVSPKIFWHMEKSSITHIRNRAFANVLAAQGRVEQAEQLFRESCDFLKDGVGENHPFYRDALKGLNDVMAAKTEPDPAEAYRRLSFIEPMKTSTTVVALAADNEPDVAGCKDDSAMPQETKGPEFRTVGCYFVRSWSGGPKASRRKSFFSLLE